MSLQALCTVAISPTLDSRAYQCRTHSEAHKVLLRQYRRWCATCFGRRTWWQRYGSVSPHLDLNILFVETYQITLIWYFHTRPLQSLNSEPVNISGRSQASLVFSDLHLFSFWGVIPFPYRCLSSGEPGTPLMASIGWGKIPDYGPPSDGTHLVCKA